MDSDGQNTQCWQMVEGSRRMVSCGCSPFTASGGVLAFMPSLKPQRPHSRIQSPHLGRSPETSVQPLQRAWKCIALIPPPRPCCLFAWSSPFGSLPFISPCHFLHSCTHRLHKRRGLGLSQALTELRNHILSNGDQRVSQCMMICMARTAICPFRERNEIEQRNGSKKNSLSAY